MTETPSDPTRAQLLRQLMAARIGRLQRAYLDRSAKDNAGAVRMLAQLRRCALDDPGGDPRVWELTLGDVPERLRGRGDELSPAERAIHAALVLYATHQQSKTEAVNAQGVGLGAAVRSLAEARGRDGALDESVIERFRQVLLAGDRGGRLRHLRSLVSLMRAETKPIALDYPRLAEDLWRIFDPDQDHTRVVTRWGRDLHNRPRNTATGESA